LIGINHSVSNLISRKPSAGMINRLMRHLFVGGIGSILYMAIVAVFVEVFYFHPVLSVTISLVLVALYTYVINRIWVYESTLVHAKSIPRFVVVAVLALSLNTGVMYLIVEILKLWYFWGLLCTVLIVPPTNFLLNYFWAFK